MKTYIIKKTDSEFAPDGNWNSNIWSAIQPLEIGEVRPESSSHHPHTQAKLSYTQNAVHGIFRVEDNYIRSVATELQDSVCRDSCVEFFFKPVADADKGYFNFEFNCGGNMLCYYIKDHTRTESGMASFDVIDTELAKQVQISHSMPETVDPEITTPTTWYLEFSIPFSILEKYCGVIDAKPGSEWRGNLYKCGDKTSHPHWISWNPVTVLNFHLPECFARLILE